VRGGRPVWQEVRGLTKAELIAEVAEKSGARKRIVINVVEAVFEEIALRLKKHEKVQISGFGTFEPRRREARIARNPRTQEEIKVAASWSLGFRPAKQLRNLVSGKSSMELR